jgi:hypothetical protein
MEKPMKISKVSPFTGKSNIMDIPCTAEQLEAYRNGALIQDAFPNCTPEQREFIKTGYTPEDWAAIFPPGYNEEPVFGPPLSWEELANLYDKTTGGKARIRPMDDILTWVGTKPDMFHVDNKTGTIHLKQQVTT